MPVAPKARAAQPMVFTAWSFSRLNDYRKCAKFAFYKHLQKLKEPGSPALERGSAVHEEAQVFAQKTARVKCPESLETFEAEFRVLQKNRATLVTEQQWCFTKEWKPTGWFDADAWCRIIVDAAYVRKEDNVLVVIDYKTGKLNDQHLEQLDLYALAGLLQYPDVAAVEVQLWYVDHGVQRPDSPKLYTMKDALTLQKKWSGAVRGMFADKVFREKPGKACTWCHYSKGKGGPCRY